MKCAIYDFETLSQDVSKGVVLSIAGMSYDENKFLDDPYTYDELLNRCKCIKFDVREQVKKYGREIQSSTLDWWKEQPKQVQEQIKPSNHDVSITELCSFLVNDLDTPNSAKIFTRGNTFDPMFAEFIFRDVGKVDPTPWGSIRDVRSYIDGFTFGTDIRHNFIPDELKDKFIAHDPLHDVSMDVYRMQYLIRTIYGKD